MGRNLTRNGSSRLQRFAGSGSTEPVAKRHFRTFVQDNRHQATRLRYDISFFKAKKRSTWAKDIFLHVAAIFMDH